MPNPRKQENDKGMIEAPLHVLGKTGRYSANSPSQSTRSEANKNDGRKLCIACGWDIRDSLRERLRGRFDFGTISRTKELFFGKEPNKPLVPDPAQLCGRYHVGGCAHALVGGRQCQPLALDERL